MPVSLLNNTSFSTYSLIQKRTKVTTDAIKSVVEGISVSY